MEICLYLVNNIRYKKKREVKFDQNVPLGLRLNFPILRILHQHTDAIKETKLQHTSPVPLISKHLRELLHHERIFTMT